MFVWAHCEFASLRVVFARVLCNDGRWFQGTPPSNGCNARRATQYRRPRTASTKAARPAVTGVSTAATVGRAGSHVVLSVRAAGICGPCRSHQPSRPAAADVPPTATAGRPRRVGRCVGLWVQEAWHAPDPESPSLPTPCPTLGNHGAGARSILLDCRRTPLGAARTRGQQLAR